MWAEKRSDCLLDGVLFVTDVRQDFVEDGELGFGGLHRQTGLSHEREHDHGVQRARRRAGVGTADEEGPGGGIEREADGNGMGFF